jgi:thiamine-monophosphate kinase
MLTRSSARPGDKIALTGYTGLSTGGFRILSDERYSEEGNGQIMKSAHLMPVPRINEAGVLLQYGVKTAIDVSDGLVSDLTHICEASKVGAIIKQNLVPIHPSLRSYFGEECMEMALTGGEDYELLFTAPQAVIEKIKERLSCPVTFIGRITEGVSGQVTVYTVGGQLTCGQGGWDHFRRQA